MSKENVIMVKDCEILQDHGNNTYEIALPKRNEQSPRVLAYRSGKMVNRKIKVIPGDKVNVEFDRNCMGRGRIVFRN